MSQELHYTSVPRGLKPGSRGFCTVGLTAHMPGPLVDRLEALSGYQPVFPPHDPSAPLNPVVLSHLRLTISGKAVSVLSRIGPAGLDYSGRPNKYAHHVVLEAAQRPEAGPAWLLSQPGFMQAVWEGEPREIPAGRTPPMGDHQPGVARAWQAHTGDGGWAGVLAESFLADSRRTVFLVFRPGMELLPLFVEAMALLPASRRWDVDFSTYFSQLPQGVGCSWRGVLEGSDDAKNARRLPGALVLDLCQALGRAEGGVLVHLARTGERTVERPAAPVSPPGGGRHIPRMPPEAGVPAADLLGETEAPRPRSAGVSHDLVPELARLVSGNGSPALSMGRTPFRRRRRRTWAVLTVLTAACLVPLAVLSYLFWTGAGIELLGSNSELSQQIATERAKVTETKNREAAESARKAAESETERLNQTRNAVAKAKADKESAERRPTLGARAHENSEANRGALVGASGKKERKETEVVFFKLPSTEESQLGHAPVKQSDHTALKNIKDIISLELSNSPAFTIERDLKAGWQIKPNASGALGTSPVARLGVKGNEISFNWLEAGRLAAASRAVRDGVLKVFGADESECTILLRDPEVSHHDAFDLTNTPDKAGHRSLVREDLKRRELHIRWAAPDDIAGTKWELGIRRWKIASHMRGPDSGSVIAEGNRNEPAAKIKKDIIPGEVALRIEIEPEKPHLLQVFIEFYREAMQRRAVRDEFLAEYRSDKHKLEDLEKGPRGDPSVERTIQKLTRRIGQDLPKMEECKQNENKERHLFWSERTELSLVVSLRLNDATVIDIAKFGEFAAPTR